MNPVTEFGLLAALAHHPRLVAAVVGLMLLLFAEPIHAAGRGSAQNPILIPGTQTTSPRIVAHARRDRVMLHRGAFEATLYSLPALAVPRGTRVCLSQDTHAAGAAALAEFDAAQ